MNASLKSNDFSLNYLLCKVDIEHNFMYGSVQLPFSAIGNHSNKGFRFYPAAHCCKPEHPNEAFQYQLVKKELWTGCLGQGPFIETSIAC